MAPDEAVLHLHRRLDDVIAASDAAEIELKTFGEIEIKNEATGEVVAIVATLNVVDRDGDVILPGAIPAGGASVMLSDYAHTSVLDGRAPVGKGRITEEGNLAMFRGRFFMTTPRGRDALLTTKEMGEDSEWSFGFPRRTTKIARMTEEWNAKGARRLISGLDAMEVSPVIRGAGLGTRTVMVKEEKPPDELAAQEKAEVEAAERANVEAKQAADMADLQRKQMADLAAAEFEKFQRTRRRHAIS